jgi:Cu/Ag efflux protein CusF
MTVIRTRRHEKNTQAAQTTCDLVHTHSALKNIDMPTINKLPSVKICTMLEQIKPGRHVMFRAGKIDDPITLTGFETITPQSSFRR